MKKAFLSADEFLSGKYLEKHKGMFWGFHETRPFMRCSHNITLTAFTRWGKVKECVAVLEEMIGTKS